jgi:hypothetical protein
VRGVPPPKPDNIQALMKEAEEMDNEQLQKMLAKLESDIGSDALSRPLARKAQTEQLNEAFDEVLKGRQVRVGVARCTPHGAP